MADPDAPDVELLADLDAGLLPTDRAAAVRRDALADPRAAAVLGALTATRADLAALPTPPVPAHLARRWTAAAAGPPPPAVPGPGAAAHVTAPGIRGTGPVHHTVRDTGPARGPGPGAGLRGPGRPRPRTVHLGALAAAVLALVTGLLNARTGGPPEVGRVELASVARSTVGLTDLGELADPLRRDACLRSAGVTGTATPDTTVLGGRQVRLDGTPGVLLVLSTGELGRFRVLVVTPSCSVLSDGTVGGR